MVGLELSFCYIVDVVLIEVVVVDLIYWCSGHTCSYDYIGDNYSVYFW